MGFAALTDYFHPHPPFAKRFTLLAQQLAGVTLGTENWQDELQSWINANPAKWWHGVWVACEIKGEPGQLNHDATRPGALFTNAKINVAENLLVFGGRNERALTAWDEDGFRARWSRADIKEMSGRFASAFVALGLQSGDRVVIHLPNTLEKVAAFIGASWLGISSVIEPVLAGIGAGRARLWPDFSPKLIITCDGYRRDGVWYDQGDCIAQFGQSADQNLKIIVVPAAGSSQDVQSMRGVLPWSDFTRLGKGGGRPFSYVSYNHELAQIYQTDGDGFTQIVSGDYLLSALQDWQLFADIGLASHILMADVQSQKDWLTMVGALATGSDLLCYDGSPCAMNEQVFWRMIERENVKIVRISENMMQFIRNNKQSPRINHQLDHVALLQLDRGISDADTAYLREECFIHAKVQVI